MRAGLSTIQQTLTADAATVLNQSIEEAGRRNHSQTTPLHVASTLLASPSGFLRNACIKSHQNSSHPLQCRALELCFSVALERLPTAQSSAAVAEPPISNALVAALKRAQAHQRRGCPEQQQQPLLAVKVELEQLTISILDDPSVSRVMREASFSSPAVKATIEQSMNNSSSAPANSTISTTISPMKISLAMGPAVPTVQSRSLYLNPRLQQQQQQKHQQQQGLDASGVKPLDDEVNKVVDILKRSRKRNPVLVGDKEPEIIVKELLKTIEEKELGNGVLRNVEVVKFDKEFASEEDKILAKLKEFGDFVAARIENSSGGVIIDLGDLKWLVEQPAVTGVIGAVQLRQQQLVSDKGKLVVAEVGKLLARFEKSGGGRAWLIGTATCETYLRCQVYHPSMENDWDLQAVTIAARASGSGLFPSLGANGIFNPSPQPLSALRNFNAATSAAPPRRLLNLDPARGSRCCPECTQKCEQEITKLAVTESGKSPSVESEGGQMQLPLWLRNAKLSSSLNKELEPIQQQKTLEIQKKWKETCQLMHSAFHQTDSGVSEKIAPMSRLMTGLCGPTPLLRPPFQPKLPINRCLGESLQLNSTTPTCPPKPMASPPRSPVRTEMVLGPAKVVADAGVKKPQLNQTKELFDVIPSEPQKKLSVTQFEKLLGGSDIESFKKLLKGLVEKVWWQREAASAIAAVMTQCKLGTGKQRGSGSKGDTWLLFAGPDRVGKRKMALALSEQVCRTGPTMISFGSRSSDRGSNMSFRGKTVLDRIAEAVRTNPFSVIMLEDFDEADILVRGSIKRAMDTGRISDSYGREISLGNVTVILAINWSPDSQKDSQEDISLSEVKLETLARSNWQLKLSICEKTAKRRGNWLDNEQVMNTKPRKETGLCLGFDLNESADWDDDKADGSLSLSNLMVKHGAEHVLAKRHPSASSFVYKELINHVDESIEFATVDFAPFVHEMASSIGKMFESIVGKCISIMVKEEAVERIMGGIWLGETGVEEWMEGVLIPCFQQLRARLPSTAGLSSDESLLAKLETVTESDDGRREGDRLPNTMQITLEGV